MLCFENFFFHFFVFTKAKESAQHFFTGTRKKMLCGFLCFGENKKMEKEILKAEHAVGDRIHAKLYYADDRVSLVHLGHVIASRLHKGILFRSEEHTSELQSRLHLVC